jgi:hypothetical protein
MLYFKNHVYFGLDVLVILFPTLNQLPRAHPRPSDGTNIKGAWSNSGAHALGRNLVGFTA